MQKSTLLISALLVAPLLLSGCDSVRKQLGYVRDEGPDEFTVVAKAPLTIPPDYTLRPPEPGAPRPQEQAPSERARDILVGEAGGFSGSDDPSAPAPIVAASVGESSLLRLAGAQNAMPNIREIVRRETSELEERETSFVDQLIFWQDPGGPPEQIDPGAEAKRLQNNSATGRPTTEGETPTIQRRKRGIFEGLLN